MVAETLGRIGPETPAAVSGLTKVLAERGGDYTWLGRSPEDLAKVPAVAERMELLGGTVYPDRKQWGERQPNALIAACNLERGWSRKMVTRTARSLGWFGPEAREALPALAYAVMLDAGDLPPLVEAAVRIDGAEAIRAAAEALAKHRDDPDRAVRLVTFIGRLGEELPGEPRKLAVAKLVEAKLAGLASAEAERWRTWLTPNSKEKKK